MEDLFVDETARGHGLGRALMAAIGGVAAARGCGCVDLNVMDWNPTRDFYERIGLRQMNQWLPYRMGEAAIAGLAATAPDAGGAWR